MNEKKHIIGVYKPSSYQCNDSGPVSIHNNRGHLFYFHKNPNNSLGFNLPQGYYRTDNNIKELPEFIDYPKLELDGEAGYLPPAKIDFKVGDNKRKASIWPRENPIRILVDKKIAQAIFDPQKAFILGHELGHRYFPGEGPKPTNKEESQNIEKNCDRFSFNTLMDLGYNPSQVIAAAYLTLQTQPERKKSIINLIKELHTLRYGSH